MRISVIATDRMISVDGLHVVHDGSWPDPDVVTLQYDTATREGAVSLATQAPVTFKDPARVKPWLDLWHKIIADKTFSADRSYAVAVDRHAAWQIDEDKRAAEEASALAKYEAVLAAANAAAPTLADEVRAEIQKIAAGR